MKCCAGWLSNCNQDCWEKYQQVQICRWHHSYDRKWTGTKEPLDDGEREEWKSWLKIQHSKNKEHGIWPHHFMANKWGKMQTVTDFIFLGFQILQMVTAAMKLKDACSSEGKLCQRRQHIEKQSYYFADKGPSSPAYGFSRSHVWMWKLDYKENWAPKNWCF